VREEEGSKRKSEMMGKCHFERRPLSKEGNVAANRKAW
jgi:hypothetical protein